MGLYNNSSVGHFFFNFHNAVQCLLNKATVINTALNCTATNNHLIHSVFAFSFTAFAEFHTLAQSFPITQKKLSPDTLRHLPQVMN